MHQVNAASTDDISSSDEDDGDDPRALDQDTDEHGVPEYFVDALKALGHRGTTPIQRECWPQCCAGRDVLGKP